MKHLLTLIFAFAAIFDTAAQRSLAKVEHGADKVIVHWNNKTAPHSNYITEKERIDEKMNVFNTTEMEMFVYPARGKATGQGMIVVPGGGYGKVCVQWDGFSVARYLQSVGVTAIVVKYRLPNNGYEEVPYEDVREALRYMRANGKKLGIDPAKVGIVGASAGGHLAGWISTTLPVEERPQHAILIYPVITGNMIYGKPNSYSRLLGNDRTATEVEHHSIHNRVDENTPPTLLLYADDDGRVAPHQVTLYYKALKRYGIESSLRIFPTGKHGWAGHDDYRYDKEIKAAMWDWLVIQNNKK